ncbi:hypothetical protein DWY84_13230 [Clostridium sp. AF27-2AA]|uniref:hypothetical protein n=1 Tax=Clostridium sp. AF27-2AA TaxID=2292206 RepID=UPI000E55276B|nr:hypothetical protein [Clostridium sp. AF27-2AA]RHQ30696.1 hypothetical protein DWY84_13230 [Clostridium sp. AF27-2AA]
MQIKTINGLSQKVKKFNKTEAKSLYDALQRLEEGNLIWLSLSGKIQKIAGENNVFSYRVNRYLRLIYKVEEEDIMVIDIIDMRKI